MSSECEKGNFFSKMKMSKERFTTLIITIALEEYKSMLSTELIESYEDIGDELYALIEYINYNTDNLDSQAYYRVAERLYYDNGDCPINCDKETKLLIKFCNVCGFDVDDYEDLIYDLLPKFPDHFEKKYGMDYYSFAVKNLAHYIRDEFHLSKGLNSKLGEVIENIVTEINRVSPRKYGVCHADIIDYMLGYGDLVFNLQDEKGLRRGELIGDLSDEAFRRITKWCFEKL